MTDRPSLLSPTSTEDPGMLPGRKLANSPLAVISLFFGLVELGLAYATGVSTGWIQIVVLAFIALFASGIALTFFVFLWKRNWVFYPPSEFLHVPVESYVNAMRDDSTHIKRIAVESVSRAFEDEALVGKLDLTEVRKEQRARAVKSIVDELRTSAIRNVEQCVFRVDARPLKGASAPQWDEPYDAEMPVYRLLDRVGLQLQPMVPHPYGAIWVLRDESSGRVFDNIGPAWAKREGMQRDKRSVQEVGIIGGMTLEVVPRRS